MGLPLVKLSKQPQQLGALLDPSIGADFAWSAAAGRVIGPPVSIAAAGRKALSGGIGINNGYAIVNGKVPSLFGTTWTECGVAFNDGANAINSLSARGSGQAVTFQPSGNNIDIVMWGVADVNVSGVIPLGIFHYAVRRAGSAHTVWINGKLVGSASDSGTPVADIGVSPAIGAQAGSDGSQGVVPLVATNAILGLFRTPRALSDAQCIALSRNHWCAYTGSQRRLLFDTPAGGTDTPINPAVGALTLTGYSPTIAQSVNQAFTPAAGSLTLTGYAPSVAQSSAAAVNPGAGSLVLTGYAPTITQPQSVAPGAGSLSITGFAPSVTQGITTTIAPGAGSLAFTGYAPSVAQSANQSIVPTPGTLAITGFAATLAQTANQSILPAVGSLAIAGYAPTVAQALASPNLTPGAGVLSIIGYAPSVVQAAPVTKIGGDDVPRDEDERIEIWEPRKPQPKRDDSLDKVVREAYAKATGKPIAAAVAKPGPSVRAPDPEPFDYDEDDFEVLLLSY